MSEVMRVVTINTGKGDGAYTRRLELLASGLERLQPDVVLLQEALAICDESGHTLNYLAERLDMQAVYAPARRKQRVVEEQRVLCASGLGVLSRYTVADSTVVPLPEHPADGERIGQLVAIERQSARALLANVHLTHLRGQDQLRRSQVSTMLAHPWFHESCWSARLIGGDFNTGAGDLSTLFKHVTCCWDWRDGYLDGGGGDPRATVPIAGPAEAGKCVDFILSVTPDATQHPVFSDATVVLDEPEDGVYPSDHRGVMVSVTLGEEKR